MAKTDDILTFQRVDDDRETQNAGETLHRGIELGLGARLLRDVELDIAFSYAKHTYEEWQPSADVELSGNEMEDAPPTIGNTTLSYRPSFAQGASLALEWIHLGNYWLNAQNTEKYDGHNLLNLRATWPVTRSISVYGKVNNLGDERYAESAGFSAFSGREFAPGLPRTFYLGVQYN